MTDATRDKPEILRTTEIARTRMFRVERLDLRFANGAEVQYERLSASARGAVLVVPLVDIRTVLLVREYAAGVHRYELGLPKGRIEGDEPVLDAANRELMEEIGHGAQSLRALTSLTLAPGYLGHTTHVVLAENLYEASLPGDEPEDIEVVPWRLDALERLMHEGECTEARTLAALFIVRDLMSER